MRHKMPEGQFRIMVRKWQALATFNVRPSLKDHCVRCHAVDLCRSPSSVRFSVEDDQSSASTTCLYSLC